MEVVEALFGKKKYVVNKRKSKVTARYDVINLYEHRKVIVAVCRDICGKPNRKKIYFWDKVTEKPLDYGNPQVYTKLEKDMFALKSGDEWTIYDQVGWYVRGGITYFSKCKETDNYIICLGGKRYFTTLDFRDASDPYISLTDFDGYGYSVAQKDYEYFVLLSKELNEVLGPINCEEVKPLSKDYFKIRKNGKYGVIDKNKNEIIPAIYDRIRMLGQNHFELMYNQKFGLANIHGNIIFECLYDEIMETADKFVVKDFARLESGKTLETKK